MSASSEPPSGHELPQRPRWYRRGWVIGLIALVVGWILGAAAAGSAKKNVGRTATTVTTPSRIVIKTVPGKTKTVLRAQTVAGPTRTVTVTAPTKTVTHTVTTTAQATPPSAPAPTAVEQPGSYDHATDAAFCSTHECIANFPNGTGYIVQCNDGEWSHSGGHSGACSDHGGES